MPNITFSITDINGETTSFTAGGSLPPNLEFKISTRRPSSYVGIVNWNSDTIHELNVFNFQGEYTDFTLKISQNFQSDIYVGESVIIDALSTPTTQYLTIDNYVGEYTDFNLTRYAFLDINSYSGDTLNATLSTLIPIPIFPEIYTGEYSVSSLFISISLNIVNSYAGEYSVVNDFTTYPSPSLIADIYTGESQNITVSTSVNIPVELYTGEYANTTTIAISQSLGTANFYTGEYVVIPEMYQEPGQEISADIFSGNYAYLDVINTATTRLRSENYSGTTLYSFDIQTALSIDIGQLLNYHGQYSEFNLSQTIALGIANVNDGNIAFFDQIDTEPNIYLYTSEYLQLQTLAEEPNIYLYTGGIFSLSHIDTEPNIYMYAGDTTIIDLVMFRQVGAKAYHGQTFETFLDTHSSIELGQINGYSGDYTVVPRSNSLHYETLSIRIVEEKEIIFEFNGYSRIDLDKEIELLFRIETSDCMDVSLTVDDVVLLFDTVPIATNTKTKLQIELADNIHKLCYGNFIPDGGNIITDLLDVLSDDCYTYNAKAGDTLYFELFHHSYIEMPGVYGARMFFDLYVKPKPPEQSEECRVTLSFGEIGWGLVRLLMNENSQQWKMVVENVGELTIPTSVLSYAPPGFVLPSHIHIDDGLQNVIPIFNFVYRANAGGGTWDTTITLGGSIIPQPVHYLGEEDVWCYWWFRTWTDYPIDANLCADMLIDIRFNQPVEVDPLILGSTMTFKLSETFRLNLFEGTTFDFFINETPNVIQVGSTMEFDISTGVLVEFLEEGCLANEELNSNGIALEYEKYKHLIKARCRYI